ncbi:MAG: hypothetical protein FWC77_00820 [Defluviitaleaceae bacterium]|nr:hypothetical protein [Defluviitaleaceae bacterium]
MKKFKPDFNEMLKVLRKEKPTRPVLFELFMNGIVYEHLAGWKVTDEPFSHNKQTIDAFAAGGYDYTATSASKFGFTKAEHESKSTKSINAAALVSDYESYEKYIWNDPDAYDYSMLKILGDYMPEGMKFMVMGPSGVLENVIDIMGYDNLCYALYEEPELVRLMFDNVGDRIVRYYKNALEFDSVGMVMSNDDWGFRTQTFLSIEHMREYVFPWHKKIVDVSHRAGRPVVLHSCGYFGDAMDLIIDELGYDAKHSYEDTILSVEDSYEKWGGRIAVMGGIDMDFLVRANVDEIKARCRKMLDIAEEKGGYALGSGNSIPAYVPIEKYMAMLETAWERR